MLTGCVRLRCSAMMQALIEGYMSTEHSSITTLYTERPHSRTSSEFLSNLSLISPYSKLSSDEMNEFQRYGLAQYANSQQGSLSDLTKKRIHDFSWQT